MLPPLLFLSNGVFYLQKITYRAIVNLQFIVSGGLLWSSWQLLIFTIFPITFSTKGNSDLCCEDTTQNLDFRHRTESHLCGALYWEMLV